MPAIFCVVGEALFKKKKRGEEWGTIKSLNLNFIIFIYFLKK